MIVASTPLIPAFLMLVFFAGTALGGVICWFVHRDLLKEHHDYRMRLHDALIEVDRLRAELAKCHRAAAERERLAE